MSATRIVGLLHLRRIRVEWLERRSFDHCLQTMEWSLLEPGVREHKFYCPGVGFVEEVQPKGGRISSELVSITHT